MHSVISISRPIGAFHNRFAHIVVVFLFVFNIVNILSSFNHFLLFLCRIVLKVSVNYSCSLIFCRHVPERFFWLALDQGWNILHTSNFDFLFVWKVSYPVNLQKYSNRICCILMFHFSIVISDNWCWPTGATIINFIFIVIWTPEIMLFLERLTWIEFWVIIFSYFWGNGKGYVVDAPPTPDGSQTCTCFIRIFT